MDAVRRIQELCAKLQVVEGQDALSREAQRNGTLLFHTLLRSTLASKRVCSEYKLSRAAWHWLTGEVETRWVARGRRRREAQGTASPALPHPPQHSAASSPCARLRAPAPDAHIAALAPPHAAS